ncbi:MAG: phage tail protein [Candidatus Wallbacteria bacterium]|nr:phage tail protein [Candidatus Wallbacteria bacterium]
MADPHLGEIRLFAFGFNPQYWHLCDGSLLPVNQNQALFSLIGSTYGGDGKTTFALPDLRGRVPVCPGPTYSYRQAQQAGAEQVQLTVVNLPQHTHQASGSSSNGTKVNPSSEPVVANVVQITTPTPPTPVPISLYGPPSTPTVAMGASAVSATGGNEGHNNMQPSLVLNFCIAIQGSYPMRN